MSKYFMPLAVFLVSLGVTDVTPNVWGQSSPTFGSSERAADSVCYAVSGEILQAGNGPALSGTTTGDLVGSVVTIGGPVVVNGEVVFRPVEQTWTITGGTVDPLIGRTLFLQNEFVGVTAQSPRVRVNTTARVVDGADRGTLTYHGTTDLSTSPITSDLQYHGVICP